MEHEKTSSEQTPSEDDNQPEFLKLCGNPRINGGPSNPGNKGGRK
jgi:hypothetical protein